MLSPDFALEAHELAEALNEKEEDVAEPSVGLRGLAIGWFKLSGCGRLLVFELLHAAVLIVLIRDAEPGLGGSGGGTLRPDMVGDDALTGEKTRGRELVIPRTGTGPDYRLVACRLGVNLRCETRL